ncbi:histidine kinase [Amycolatopsis sp. K13G38]|uniref:Histidine kinase n=1 Tax=Amycolatopsis acididurans TaxID=2724524 RepID=A0ABX1JDP9_9PSEU|nr:histidine kinase [Amycolatopsis acididurans]NKQ57869.1 histidine kinase [Amycolatopsis acididurans]
MRQRLATAAIVTAILIASGSWSPQQGPAGALLTAAQVLPLLTRRHPGRALVVITGATVAHFAIEPRNLVYVPMLVALYAVPGIWLAAPATAALAIAVFPAKGPLDGSLLAVAVCVMAWLMGAERRRQLADRTERAARSLHDTLAQTTAVMLVQAETLRAVGNLSDADRERLDTLVSAGRGALTLVRRTLRDLEAGDAPPDLAAVLAQLRTAGLVLDGDPDLSALGGRARPAAERVVAEVATNALRHNGPGVRLRFSVEAGPAVVEITARNATTATGRTGFGLTSLEQDVRALGGSLTAGAHDGEWVVTARLPRSAVTRSGTGSRAA